MRFLAGFFPRNKRAMYAGETAQFLKVREEYDEFFEAVYFGGDDVEEAIDLMIALDGWIEKQPEHNVRNAIDKVLRKGADRGDWEVD